MNFVLDISYPITWCIVQDLVLGKPCWLSTLNYRVCSICLSFFCIVYNTKIQHGDPDVWITLLRCFQAITKQKKGTSALFWSCPRLDRQSSVFKETLCKTPLEGQKALHTIQYRQVVVDKFAKWLSNIASKWSCQLHGLSKWLKTIICPKQKSIGPPTMHLHSSNCGGRKLRE